MTVKECYELVGADYQNTAERLGSEALVKRFALKFLQDLSFQRLKEAVSVCDGETAFRMAHTLKGVCLNLGFTELGKVAAVLTEVLRGDWNIDQAKELLNSVEEEYQKLVSALKQIES